MTAFREAFPILMVDDVERASAFYCSTLGFEEAYRNEDEHGVEFVFLSLEPYGIGIGRRADGETHDVALWIYADDVDAAAADLREAGAKEVLRRQTSRGANGCARSSTRTATSSTSVRRPSELVFLKHKLESPRVTMRVRPPRKGACVSETQSPLSAA